MKRILFALVLVALSLAVVGPAFAQETCDHGMHGVHEPTIASLSNHVKHAREMNHIATDDLANSLLDKLNAAQAAQDRGQVKTAVNNVNAFINQVNAQSGKAIAADCADHLLMHAGHVVMALQGEM
jgi:hypothetical protein